MSPDVVQAETRMSAGRRPVEQPRSKAAKDVPMIKGPSALTTVLPPHPHTSTIPDRQDKALRGPVAAVPRRAG